ncbi:MAG: VOC family protein [Acidobacteria bacterium]|nr:VOC family protein [Acidobacteriota bacterium]
MLDKLDYIILMVSDMRRSVEFYRDALGLTLKFESPGWAEFQTGETTLALHPAGAQAGAPGAFSLGFMVDDLEETYGVLSARGVSFNAPPAEREGAGRLAVCADPDGHPISLSERRR